MAQKEFSLKNLAKTLWRLGWVLVLLVLVSGGVAWKVSSEQAPVYEATATVMVESSQQRLASLPAGLGTGIGLYPQDIASQMMVMQSRSVLERAVTQLEPEKAKDPEYLQSQIGNLQNALKVAQVGTTSLVGVTVTSPDSDEATGQANAVAEAYVSETRSSTQTAIETNLAKITKERTRLTGSEIDLSTDPSLPLTTAQIDVTLAILRAATQDLAKVKAGGALPTPAPPAKDSGTVLTPLQLSTIGQRVAVATNEAKELSVLAQKLNWEPTAAELDFEAHSAVAAIMEGRTRVLATKLGTLSKEVEAARQAETDPQVNSQLLAVGEQLGVANATVAATLEQVVSVFQVEQQLRVAMVSSGALIDQLAMEYGVRHELPFSTVTAAAIPMQAVGLHREEDMNLLRRIVQHTALAATALESVSGQLQEIRPRTGTLKEWELESLTQILRERLSETGASAIAVLDELSRQLQPSAPGRGIVLTSAELASMEIRARTVAANLAFLLSEAEKTQLNNLDPQYPQYYTELVGVREGLRAANDAVKGLPDRIAGLATGGSDGLSFASLDNLRQQLQLALFVSSGGGARVVDKAMFSVPVTEPFKRFKNVIIAGIAALLLAVLSVVMLQYFDRKVRSSSQVTSYVGIPLLASISSVKGAGNPHPPSILKGTPPSYLEAFRMLRTNLGLDSRPGEVVVISSPGEKEGKTTIAANLARAIALQGRKVLLVDGNLRKPDIAAAFGLIEVDGLSEFLTGGKEPRDYVTQADGVDILPVRAASAKSAEELSSPRMTALFEKARQVYDVVIVDSAPVMGYSDTRILAKAADYVLLVLHADASTLDLARESKQALETTGVRVAGFVLIQKTSEKSKHLPYSLHRSGSDRLARSAVSRAS